MEIAAASRPAPGSPNDDTYVVGPRFAAVFDGATAPTGRVSGCIHDVPWLVAQLSGHLASVLAVSDDYLTDVVAEAIDRTCRSHRDTCDLSNPDSPSSTLTVVRADSSAVEYLVLGDSPLVIQGFGETTDAIVDDRVDHLPSYGYDAVAQLRNSPDGFWVASTYPAAARHAVTGSVPRDGLDQVLLLTDGCSRLTTRHGRPWAELLSIAKISGPRALVGEAHAADAQVPEGAFAGKRFDDATAVLCRM